MQKIQLGYIALSAEWFCWLEQPLKYVKGDAFSRGESSAYEDFGPKSLLGVLVVVLKGHAICDSLTACTQLECIILN